MKTIFNQSIEHLLFYSCMGLHNITEIKKKILRFFSYMCRIKQKKILKNPVKFRDFQN